MVTSTDVEIRFQSPTAEDDESWEALGLIEELAPGRARARVAAPGDFALTVTPGDDTPAMFELVLENVAPAVVVAVGPLGAEVDRPAPAQPGTARSIMLDLSGGEPLWVRGRLACPSRFRVAALGDIQTQGWELVSSSVLMDGAVALFWKRPAPRGDDTRRIPTTYL